QAGDGIRDFHVTGVQTCALPIFGRIPDQSLVAENGERYSRLMATRTDDYAFVYTYNGQEIKVNMGKIKGQEVKASWFNPRTGETTKIGVVENRGVQTFRPEGAPEDGNDWVLILDSL